MSKKIPVASEFLILLGSDKQSTDQREVHLGTVGEEIFIHLTREADLGTGEEHKIAVLDLTLNEAVALQEALGRLIEMHVREFSRKA